jgi:hypothetical protein
MQLHPEMLSWLYHEGRRTKGIHLTVFCMMIQYTCNNMITDYLVLYRLQYTVRVLTVRCMLYLCTVCCMMMLCSIVVHNKNKIPHVIPCFCFYSVLRW